MASLARACRAAAPAIFLMLVAMQGFHMAEHVAQVVQRFGLGMQEAHGLAGELVDREIVHMAYNTVLLGGLALVAWALLPRPGPAAPASASAPRLWAGLLLVALAVQSYHEIEHIVKFEAFLATGLDDRPGLLGTVFPPLLVHFAFNLAVLLPMMGSYLLWRRSPDRRGAAGDAEAFPPVGPSLEPSGAR